MRIITLEPVPNQAITVVLDNVLYEIRLVTLGGGLCVSIRRNNQTVVDGARAVAGQAIIQDKHRAFVGNFVIITSDGDLVDYQKFGVSQFLAYYTAGDF